MRSVEDAIVGIVIVIIGMVLMYISAVRISILIKMCLKFNVENLILRFFII